MRGRDTIEFLGLWESLHNSDFKPVEFDGFKKETGANSFTMSPTKWIKSVSASEADILNVALFGTTAKQWKNGNPEEKGNIRDSATINQLLVLANMESYNAILIEQEKKQSERLVILRELAVKQIRTLNVLSKSSLQRLENNKL